MKRSPTSTTRSLGFPVFGSSWERRGGGRVEDGATSGRTAETTVISGRETSVTTKTRESRRGRGRIHWRGDSSRVSLFSPALSLSLSLSPALPLSEISEETRGFRPRRRPGGPVRPGWVVWWHVDNSPRERRGPRYPVDPPVPETPGDTVSWTRSRAGVTHRPSEWTILEVLVVLELGQSLQE